MSREYNPFRDQVFYVMKSFIMVRADYDELMRITNRDQYKMLMLFLAEWSLLVTGGTPRLFSLLKYIDEYISEKFLDGGAVEWN